jgi:hypothetical protein
MKKIVGIAFFSLILVALLTFLYNKHCVSVNNEGFTDAITADDDTMLAPRCKWNPIGAGQASLDKPREPYSLLKDVLKLAPSGNVSCMTNRCCPETDFETRTELTGNYVQRTNNYKREYPDNCSAPFKELTLSFYEPTVLGSKGKD